MVQSQKKPHKRNVANHRARARSALSKTSEKRKGQKTEFNIVRQIYKCHEGVV